MSTQPAFSTDSALAKQLEAAQVGLFENGAFQPVSVVETPYRLSATLWQVAWRTAQSLGELFSAVSRNRSWLSQALLGSESSSLSSQLLRRLPEKLLPQNNVLLTRHDLMLDRKQQWRLIESNSIAAGMGPFSEKLSHLLAVDTEWSFAPNEASVRQAEGLYRAATELRGVQNPVVVFVVEANENNVYDQKMLADALTRLGATVLFKTLHELKSERVENQENLLSLCHVGIVDLLYFRTGYNLDDYNDEFGDARSLLNFRGELEYLNVKLCPSIAGQLATHKWVQRQLSLLSVSDLMAQFQLTVQPAIQAYLALQLNYKSVDSTSLKKDLNSGNWLIKTTAEGGGNVHDSFNNLPELDALQHPFLMQKIQPFIRKEPVVFQRGQRRFTLTGTVSELGLFTVGDDHRYAGYLLRTKAVDELECGVHKGYGAIDSVIIVAH